MKIGFRKGTEEDLRNMIENGIQFAHGFKVFQTKKIEPVKEECEQYNQSDHSYLCRQCNGHEEDHPVKPTTKKIEHISMPGDIFKSSKEARLYEKIYEIIDHLNKH